MTCPNLKSIHFVVLLLYSCGIAASAPNTQRLTPYRARFRAPVKQKQQQPELLRSLVRKELLSQCKEHWRNATLDHFTWAKPEVQGTQTFLQRYYVCSSYWRNSDEEPGPIFFYLGNEANVLLYLNNTGLMWESAHDFGALLVFAEHRYYGESLPFEGASLRKHMGYLTAEQALADYAEVITEVKESLDAQDAPVIGFGGSYGGMLATWMRLKYPHILNGAIAASAPIWVFYGEKPETNPYAFARGTTYDASAAAGSAGACIDNVRRGWGVLLELGQTQSGRQTIRHAAGLCDNVPLDSGDDVIALRDWLSSAWDYMAMGNYPYRSSYILNGVGTLPPFPVRVACKELAKEGLKGEKLIAGLVRAAGVYHNSSGTEHCVDYRAGPNEESDRDGDFWGYQYCTEMLMPFSRDGVKDMFWNDTFDLEAAKAQCQSQWGVTPDVMKASVEWGGRNIGSTSNIVFSNGLLDPWHGGGVLRDISETLLAAIIPEGAHHLDLMFSNPADPGSVIECRNFEREQIRQWIAEARDTTYRCQDVGCSRRGGSGSSARGGARLEGAGTGLSLGRRGRMSSW